ncbi:MAG TPA: ABC transporter permease subunit [Thermoplasmata archaeon]|nr:ABC transporter permease subunit [Thermoplasmata archaeon]
MRESLHPFAFLAPVGFFLLLFGLLPVAVLFGAGVASEGGVAGVARVLADPLNAAALRNSLLQGSLSALGAFLVGYPVGLFLGRHEWRGRRLVQGLLLVPFLLPSLVVVLAVQALFGPAGYLGTSAPALRILGEGVGGIVAVNVLFNLPVVALLTAVGVESSSSALEETALTLGASPARAYRDVWGLPSLVGAAAGALLTFLFSALAFAAPILLCGPRCYTLEARVFSLATILLDPAAASVLALLMVAFLAAPAALYLFVVYRLRRRAGASRRRRVVWRNPATMLLASLSAIVVGGIVLVLGVILGRSILPTRPGGPWGDSWSALLSPRVPAALGISLGGALVNTLLFATAAALLALLLGVVTGHATTRRPRAGQTVQFLLFLPLLLSPVVLAFALAQFWRPLLGGESAVWLLILLSQAMLALPFALQTLQVALLRLPSGPRESARLLGASPFRAYVDADLPALGGALIAATLFAFAIGLGEFTATYFLATPAFTTLPVLLYDLDGIRQVAAANAAAAVLLLVSLGVLLAIALGGRRVEL